jgi:hypothetical protein
LALALAVGIAVSGCSGEEDTLAVKLVKNVVLYVVDIHPPPAPLSDLATAVGDSVDKSLSIKAGLDAVAASGDPVWQAISTAVCAGLGEVAQDTNQSPTSQQPSQQSWETFLVQQLDMLVPNNPVADIQADVDQFTVAAKLADINPHLAVTYYKDCPKGG